MVGPIAQAPPKVEVESTYKAREIEGFFDLCFYRPIGFRLAQIFARFNATPAQVTFLSACLGIVAGHLYFYQNLAVNVIGMVLHVVSNIFDNADGQLARLTNQGSRLGRATDGLADHLVFASIYLHLVLRYLVGGASPTIVILAVAAALSHAWQASLADYFRNTYLLFVNGKSRSEADSSAGLRSDDERLTWQREPWKKILIGLYLGFTQQQEFFAPKLRALRDAATQHGISNQLRLRFREAAQPDLRWWGFSMTNTRMAFLFLFLLIGQPIWYLWLEVIAFNLLVALLLFRQERMAQSLVQLSILEPAIR